MINFAINKFKNQNKGKETLVILDSAINPTIIF